jgi:hypothetical protein
VCEKGLKSKLQSTFSFSTNTLVLLPAFGAGELLIHSLLPGQSAGFIFYAPEAHIMYLTVSSSFLISFVMGERPEQGD